jgi:hypothetical protein
MSITLPEKSGPKKIESLSNSLWNFKKRQYERSENMKKAFLSLE